MFWFWLLMGLVLAVIWVGRIVDAALGMRKVAEIDREEWDRSPEPAPRVSIIVPARNEESRLQQALTSVLTLDYPNYEVLAINDRSTDATGLIMEGIAAEHMGEPKLEVMHVKELPPGWLGKPHAMWGAAKRATGEWLLFTDADVIFRRDSLRRAMYYAQQTGADHLVLFPTQTDWTPGKKIILAGFNMLFVFGHRPWKIADPKSHDHMGVGAFNLVRREVHDAVGTFEALRMEVIEDMRFGKLVKDSGFRQDNVFGRDLLRLPWGDGAMGIVRNLTKNFFALMQYSVARAIGASCLLLFLNLLPFLGIWLAPGWAKIGYALALASIFGLYVGMSWSTPISPVYFVFHPVATLLLLYTILRSMAHTLWHGGIVWRETKYPLDELRRGIVQG